MSGPPSWDGSINLPSPQPLSSVIIPAGIGVVNTVTAVVEIGVGDTPLTFDKAVRIQFDGQGGKKVGYTRSGTYTEITTVCSADTQAAGDAVPAAGDCKITVGADLVVWTKHFTRFSTHTSSSTSSTGTASAGNVGGHRTGVGPSGGAGGFGAAAPGEFGGILEPTEPFETVIDAAAPKIFDVKFQVANGTKFRATETTSQYADDQPLSVYSIIDSQSTIKRAELRFIKIGDAVTDYTAIVMDVQPLEISDTAYAVSATIPQRLLQGPAVTLWIHVINDATKVADSDKYTIAVTPDYSIDGKLELESVLNKAEGTITKPTAYFTNNGDRPVYGVIHLMDEENIVYTSLPQLFESGETVVKLEWPTPTFGKIHTHQIQAKAEFYGKSFESSPSSITTFPSTKTVPLSRPVQIDSIKDDDGNVVANPTTIYSSFKDEGKMRFRVVSPDGTCVIGGSKECLVTQSTTGLSGNLKSIAVGDQIYRVRYSGPENPLERFSITSIDPIVGHWTVEIDSEDGFVPQAHAMKDAVFKVKYRAQETPFVIE
jgi:hypothetical protein